MMVNKLMSGSDIRLLLAMYLIKDGSLKNKLLLRKKMARFISRSEERLTREGLKEDEKQDINECPSFHPVFNLGGAMRLSSVLGKDALENSYLDPKSHSLSLQSLLRSTF